MYTNKLLKSLLSLVLCFTLLLCLPLSADAAGAQYRSTEVFKNSEGTETTEYAYDKNGNLIFISVTAPDGSESGECFAYYPGTDKLKIDLVMLDQDHVDTITEYRQDGTRQDSLSYYYDDSGKLDFILIDTCDDHGYPTNTATITGDSQEVIANIENDYNSDGTLLSSVATAPDGSPLWENYYLWLDNGCYQEESFSHAEDGSVSDHAITLFNSANQVLSRCTDVSQGVQVSCFESYSYDEAGEPITTSVHYGDPASPMTYSETLEGYGAERDKNGRVTRFTYICFSKEVEEGVLTDCSLEDSYTATRSYNADGNLTGETAPGYTVTITYAPLKDVMDDTDTEELINMLAFSQK